MQLVINTFGASLRNQGDRFLVQAGPKPWAVSAHEVQIDRECDWDLPEVEPIPETCLLWPS